MEEMVEEAGKKEGREREELLKNACAIYQGEFLPEMYSEVWAAVENIRLKNLYADAVYQLCEIWKEQQEYQQMLELCTKAAEYYPYEE